MRACASRKCMVGLVLGGPVTLAVQGGSAQPTRQGKMAAFMRLLGCQRAMLLDGGISSLLAIRRADGTVLRWSNWRAVPLGLVASPR